jgi:ADP-ribose pyrophosphatase
MDYLNVLKQYPWLVANPEAGRGIRILTVQSDILAWQDEKRAQLVSKGQPTAWADIGVILNDPYILVLRDLVEFPNGRRGGYFRVLNQADLQGGQGVAVLAEMNGKYPLLYLFRHPTRSWSYEVPRGFGEPGVAAEEQASNEVLEEVEGEIAELVDLGLYHSNTGLEGNKVKIFYARLKSIGKPAEDEGIESILWVSLAELEEMIASAKITDGFTIAAYTRAKLRGLLT